MYQRAVLWYHLELVGMRVVANCCLCMFCMIKSAIKVYLKIFAVSKEYAGECWAQYPCMLQLNGENSSNSCSRVVSIPLISF